MSDPRIGADAARRESKGLWAQALARGLDVGVRPATCRACRNGLKRLKIGECVVLFKFMVVVKDDERAFLVRDGRFERLLGPGRFVALDYGAA